MTIVGKQLYESDYNGNHYSGIRLFITEPRDGVEGLSADMLKVPTTKPRFKEICDIPVGAEIIPIYNKYGNVEDVQLVVKSK